MRNVTPADLDRVIILLERIGLGAAYTSEEKRLRWEKFWLDNPAMQLDRPKPDLGWILEASEEIVGFFGNVPRRYFLGKQEILVSIASSWAVYKEFRSHTKLLSTAYFNQKNADLLMVTTAIVPTERIFTRFAGGRMPQTDYKKVLFWILDSQGFIQAALKKKKISEKLAFPVSLAASPLVSAALSIRGQRLGKQHPGIDTEVTALDKINHEFDELWYRKIKEKRLYAARTAEDIHWSYGKKSETTTLLTCRIQNQLEGYLILTYDETKDIQLKRAKIADMLVASNNPKAIDSLWAAAQEIAIKKGCHVLEMIGFPTEIRSQALQYKPFSRMYPNFPYCYKALKPDLKEILQSENAWYPTLYDGDSSL